MMISFNASLPEYLHRKYYRAIYCEDLSGLPYNLLSQIRVMTKWLSNSFALMPSNNNPDHTHAAAHSGNDEKKQRI